MIESSRGASRVAVVGVGNVGSTFAYALLLGGLASEIVLIDANRARAEGESMGLSHAIPFAHATRVWAGVTRVTAPNVVGRLAATHATRATRMRGEPAPPVE